MTGDENSQPGESDDTLSALAEAMTEGDGPEDEGDEVLPVDDDEAEEEEADEEEEDEEEETVTITHNGKTVTVTKSEHDALAQKGFDYTHKTMELAEDRKAVEAERGKWNETVTKQDEALQTTLTRLEAFSQYVESQVGNPPSIELAHQNAAQYLALKEAHEAQKGQLRQTLSDIQSVKDEATRLRQAANAFKAEETWNALADTLPGWKEDADGKFNELAKYAKSVGLDPRSAGDAFLTQGLWQLANKAQQFDKLQADKAKLKPVEQLRKVTSPKGVRQNNRADKTEAAFYKNPSVDTLGHFFK